jgi:predicted O-methyltransferase YrrM
MNLNLNLDLINKIVHESDFFKIHSDFYKDSDYYVIPGEHYALFLAIASQLSNKKIIEIGTCIGHSALVFSYNSIINNNNIYTYDINSSQINLNKLTANNIKFSTENLMNSNYRNLPHIKEHILSSDIIFIDIDPHIGLLEYEFYLFLRKENFKGIIIFDDIYMGKQGHAFEHRKLLGHFMYENLWSKIPDYEKICVSHLGHVSGTGIINFNSNNKIIIN